MAFMIQPYLTILIFPLLPPQRANTTAEITEQRAQHCSTATEKNVAEKFEESGSRREYFKIIHRIESDRIWIEPISFKQKNYLHIT